MNHPSSPRVRGLEYVELSSTHSICLCVQDHGRGLKLESPFYISVCRVSSNNTKSSRAFLIIDTKQQGNFTVIGVLSGFFKYLKRDSVPRLKTPWYRDTEQLTVSHLVLVLILSKFDPVSAYDDFWSKCCKHLSFPFVLRHHLYDGSSTFL